MTAGFDRRLLRRRFGAAAARYTALAVLQREVESRLLERLDGPSANPEVIVDVGSGPGGATRALRRRHRDALVVALDLALPMLRLARRSGGWWRRSHPVVCADAAALPLADASVDLVFSSLCLQWLDDPVAALAGFRRVLRPGGQLLLASFGPDTLGELREAWAAADRHGHVSEFPPMALLGDALIAQGWHEPVLDRDLFTLSYASLDDLLAELRGIGAGNARADRARGLAGRGAWQRMRAEYEAMRDHEGRLPATYEVVYLRAVAPPPGQPVRSAGADIATIPVSAIRRPPRH
jgi:malonyl-CoA O-methyltransferase